LKFQEHEKHRSRNKEIKYYFKIISVGIQKESDQMNSFPWKQRLGCRAGYHFNQSLRVVRFIAAKGPEIIFCFSWMMIILFLFLD